MFRFREFHEDQLVGGQQQQSGESAMIQRDEKLTLQVKGWMFIAEGVVAIAGALFLLWLNITTPMLPWIAGVLVALGILVPALWFIRNGRRSLEQARQI